MITARVPRPSSVLGQPSPKRASGTPCQAVSSDPNHSLPNTRKRSVFTTLEEEIHTPRGPVHASVALAEKPGSSGVSCKTFEQFVEASDIGEPFSHGLLDLANAVARQSLNPPGERKPPGHSPAGPVPRTPGIASRQGIQLYPRPEDAAAFGSGHPRTSGAVRQWPSSSRSDCRVISLQAVAEGHIWRTARTRAVQFLPHRTEPFGTTARCTDLLRVPDSAALAPRKKSGG